MSVAEPPAAGDERRLRREQQRDLIRVAVEEAVARAVLAASAEEEDDEGYPLPDTSGDDDYREDITYAVSPNGDFSSDVVMRTTLGGGRVEQNRLDISLAIDYLTDVRAAVREWTRARGGRPRVDGDLALASVSNGNSLTFEFRIARDDADREDGIPIAAEAAAAMVGYLGLAPEGDLFALATTDLLPGERDAVQTLLGTITKIADRVEIVAPAPAELPPPPGEPAPGQPPVRVEALGVLLSQDRVREIQSRLGERIEETHMILVVGRLYELNDRSRKAKIEDESMARSYQCEYPTHLVDQLQEAWRHLIRAQLAITEATIEGRPDLPRRVVRRQIVELQILGPPEDEKSIEV